MSILKKIFQCTNDDTIIGLCKFNSDLPNYNEARKNAKKRLNKELTISQLLKKATS